MNFFKRIKVLWLGFWSQLLNQGEERNQTAVAEGLLRTQETQLKRLKDAMTNLVFQKKKLDRRLDDIRGRMETHKADLEQAVRENRDELAMKLLESVETLREEGNFVSSQIRKLETDLVAAKGSEKELRQAIEESKRQIGVLAGRYEALKLRKQVRDEIQSVTDGTGKISTTVATQKLKDQISRLEAEIEGLEVDAGESWKAELDEMRSRRKRTDMEKKLVELKKRMGLDPFANATPVTSVPVPVR